MAIVFFESSRKNLVEHLIKENNDLNESDFIHINHNDLIYQISDDGINIWDSEGVELGKNADFIYFIHPKYNAENVVIANYAKQNNIPYADEFLRTFNKGSKIMQFALLSYEKLPIVNTFYSPSPLENPLFLYKLLNTLSFPLIMKATKGIKGKDNYLLESKSELLQKLKENADKTNFIFQDYVPNEFDYRLLVANYKVISVSTRRRNPIETHLNNAAKGAEEAFIDLKDAPKDLCNLAEKASRAVQRNIAGVDIIIDKHTQKPYILEVNQSTCISYNSKESAAITDFFYRMIK